MRGYLERNADAHRRTLELLVTAEKTWIEAMNVFTKGEDAVHRGSNWSGMSELLRRRM